MEIIQELRDDINNLIECHVKVVRSEERKKQIVDDCINDLKSNCKCGLERMLTENNMGYIPLMDVIMNHLSKEENDTWKYNYVSRYIVPHQQTYNQALQEVRNGKKETHWMWWIFPQMKGLGTSERSRFYGISDRYQAELYLNHPILGNHLIEITQAVLDNDKTPYEIFGSDVIKFRSCMKLFASLNNSPAVFQKVLNKYNWL